MTTRTIDKIPSTAEFILRTDPQGNPSNGHVSSNGHATGPSLPKGRFWEVASIARWDEASQKVVTFVDKTGVAPLKGEFTDLLGLKELYDYACGYLGFGLMEVYGAMRFQTAPSTEIAQYGISADTPRLFWSTFRGKLEKVRRVGEFIDNNHKLPRLLDIRRMGMPKPYQKIPPPNIVPCDGHDATRKELLRLGFSPSLVEPVKPDPVIKRELRQVTMFL